MKFNMREYSEPATRRRQYFAGTLMLLGALIILFGKPLSHVTGILLQPGGIYVPQPHHNFQPAEQSGKDLVHTFRIYNLRPAGLALEAQPDCGCTGISWKKTTIKPFGWVDLTTKIEARRGKNASQQSVSITLKTNREGKRYVFLYLRA